MPFNNELPEYESLLEFQEVYLLAIALTWKDNEFKHLLIDNPDAALKNYFGYVCPWNVKLKVTPAPTGEWHREKGKWHLPKNTISVGVPVVPVDDEEVCIALAAYNDAGPTYLFTCC